MRRTENKGRQSSVTGTGPQMETLLIVCSISDDVKWCGVKREGYEIDSAYYVLYYLDVWYEGASLDKHEAGEGQAVWKRRPSE